MKLLIAKEKQTIKELRMKLLEARNQNEFSQNIIHELRCEFKNFESMNLKGSEGKVYPHPVLLEKVVDLQREIGMVYGENRVLRKEKADIEIRVIELEKALEEQNLRIEQEMKELMEYNTRLQDEATKEKKKFLDYLHNMNQFHVARQEDQVGTRNNLQDEVEKSRKAMLEKNNAVEMLNIKHLNELKKLQSELDVAREFGDSHLREIENLKWVIILCFTKLRELFMILEVLKISSR